MTIKWNQNSAELNPSKLLGGERISSRASNIENIGNSEKNFNPNAKKSSFNDFLKNDPAQKEKASPSNNLAKSNSVAPTKPESKSRLSSQPELGAKVPAPISKETELKRFEKAVEQKPTTQNSRELNTQRTTSNNNFTQATKNNLEAQANTVGPVIPEGVRKLLNDNSIAKFLRGDLSQFDGNSVVEFVSTNPFISKMLSTEVTDTLNAPKPLADILKEWGLDSKLMAQFSELGLDQSQLTTPSQLLSMLGIQPENVVREINKLKSALENGGLGGYIAKASKQRARSTHLASNIDAPIAMTSSKDSITDPNSKNPSSSEILNPNAPSMMPSSDVPKDRMDKNSTSPKIASSSLSNQKESTLTSPQVAQTTGNPSLPKPPNTQGSSNLKTPGTINSSNLVNTPLEYLDVATGNLAQDLSQNTNPLTANLVSFDPYTSFGQSNNSTLENVVQLDLSKDLGKPQSNIENIPNLVTWETPTATVVPTETNDQYSNIMGLMKKNILGDLPINHSLEKVNVDVLKKDAELFAPDKDLAISDRPANLDILNNNVVNQKIVIDPTPTSDSLVTLDKNLDDTSSLLTENKTNPVEQNSSGENSSSSGESFGERLSNFESNQIQHNKNHSNNIVKTDFSKHLDTHQVKNLSDQIVQNASMFLKDGGGSMQIDLKSPELGDLKLAFSLNDKNLDIKILTESQSSRELLMQELPKLKESLSAHNINLKDVSLGVGTQLGEGGKQDQYQSLKEQQDYIRSFSNNIRQTQNNFQTKYRPNIQSIKGSNQFGRIQIAA